MLKDWIKSTTKEILPNTVYGFLHGIYAEINGWVQNPKVRMQQLFGPAGQSGLSRYINNWAAKRVLEAIIVKTDDVKTATWLGQPIWQYPQDVWIIQEVIGEFKPDLIIETGTFMGGSAYFFACLCELLNHGKVVSIDISPVKTIPHDRITYITGSSIEQNVVEQVKNIMSNVNPAKVLVILDSAHNAEHVLNELKIYSKLIPVGSYIHIQDGCIDVLPQFKKGRPGPLVAVKEFLRETRHFTREIDIELKYVMTAHPYGWIRKIAAD